MKTARTITAMLLTFAIVGLLTVVPAKAAYLYLEPGEGSLEAANGNTFSVGLFFNPRTDGIFSITSFAYEFDFDSNEVAFNSAILLPSWSFFINSPTVTGNKVTVKAYTSPLTQLSFSEESPQKLMSLVFALISPPHSFDGFADVELISQINQTNRGMTTPFVVGGPAPVTYQYGGAIGPDVGATPVPVPAALWLFGGGLVGLAGLKRKRG